MSPPKKSPLKRILYIGNFLWTPSLGQLKVLENAVIGVDENGTIAFALKGGGDEPIEPAQVSGDVQLRCPFLEKVRQHGWKDGEWDRVVVSGLHRCVVKISSSLTRFSPHLCIVSYCCYPCILTAFIARILFILPS